MVTLQSPWKPNPTPLDGSVVIILGNQTPAQSGSGLILVDTLVDTSGPEEYIEAVRSRECLSGQHMDSISPMSMITLGISQDSIKALND